MDEVRVRFAPSPTGHLHIGSARTAIINWLYARHRGGKFLLRIEDTDRERSKQEYTDAIMGGLKWLGLSWDEDPVFQGTRLPVYLELAEKLVTEDKAYYCSCTPAELEQMRELALKTGGKPKYDGRCRNKKIHAADRPKVIRFKSTGIGQTVVNDVIQGKVSFDNSEMDDLIIIRSDQTPTYNFSAVIDDHWMNITHVIRGNDHLNNTPRQIQIYQAFGYQPPAFAHHPLILGTDRAKLSKRHGATGLLDFQGDGFLPEAMTNFLLRIGWSHGDQEIFSAKEMIDLFDITDLNPAPGVWNQEKLLWTNGVYIRQKPAAEIAQLALPFFQKRGYTGSIDERFVKMVELYQVRVQTLAEMVELAWFLFADRVEYDEEAKKNFLTKEIADALEDLASKIASLGELSAAALKPVFELILVERKIKMKALAQPVRVALTGKTVSPGLFEVIELLGKDKTVERLKQAAAAAKG